MQDFAHQEWVMQVQGFVDRERKLRHLGRKTTSKDKHSIPYVEID